MKKISGLETKIALIERGIPMNVTDEELIDYEETLRGAARFYIDMLVELDEAKQMGVEPLITAEEKNLASVLKSLRKVDNARLVLEGTKITKLH